MSRGSGIVPAVTVCLALCLSALPARAGNSGFVTTNGVQFSLNGQPHYFVGANFWQGMNLASAGPSGDRARLARELDRFEAMGVTNLRIMAGSEGPDTEPYRIVPALQTAPGAYNADVLDGLDYLIAELDARNMRAVMGLNNFWHWSGGMAQYVSWHESSAIPYPNDTGDWGLFQEYSRKFYTYPQCQTWFRDFVATLVSRTNPYTGRQYRDEPAIFSWELANEPRRYPASWIDDTAAYVKSLDPNHMVTTGSEGRWGAETYLPGWEERDFVPTHDGPDIDYATCHIWPQNWGWYDPQQPSTYAAAETNARDYLGDHLEDAELELGKPLVLEEFGLARDWEPLHDIHDPDSPTTYRDQFYAAMYADVHASAAGGGAAAGDNFWAWAGEARPPSAWTGDPPHEVPGWYSVYDADATTNSVISSHADAMYLLAPRRGDATADRRIDGADYTVWADHYKDQPVAAWSQGGWAVGNFNEDDRVDGADYTIWADNYDVGPAAGGVPDASCVLLLAAGGIPALLRRRPARQPHLR